MQSEARAADEWAELQRQIRIAPRQRRVVHLSDPSEDVMLLLLLLAAVVWGLLTISGSG